MSLQEQIREMHKELERKITKKEVLTDEDYMKLLVIGLYELAEKNMRGTEYANESI